MTRIMLAALALGSTLAFVLTGTSAFAQIDSTPPLLMGQRSFHIYSVPFVRSGGVEPFFECTNTSDVAIRVGIEAFSGGGLAFNDPSATSLDIPPSGTRLFGPTNAWVGPDGDPGIAVSRGSARILATQKKGIICTAFLADVFNAPPTSMVHLTIVAKLKQKGD
jgi:hypothetical protein